MSGVRSSCETSRDEALLHPRQVGELPDLALQAVGHPVERAGQRRELVVAALGQALLELPGRELLAGLGRDPHRADDEPHHQVGDRADQQHQREPAEHQGLLHEVEGLLHVARGRRPGTAGSPAPAR